MLPARYRVRQSSEFSSVVRSGRRSGTRTLVVHHRAGAGQDCPRVGFVVSKAVGVSVVRHRVTRRLRAQVAERLSTLPAGSLTVVRALPPAADATSAQLGRDLDKAFRTLVAGPRPSAPSSIASSTGRERS